MNEADRARRPQTHRFEDDDLGLRLTVGRSEILFTKASSGTFAGPDADAITAVERLSGIEFACWAQDEQVHGSEVRVIADGDDVAAFSRPCDAQVTARDDVLCAVRTADCLPVLLAGDDAVGAVHAGWRGLAEGVLAAAVAAISELGEAQPTAVIGPGARGCCYEVGDDLLATFADYPAATHGLRNLDLAVIATAQLTELGVANIYDCGTCTICSRPEQFFSFRRDSGNTGRMLGAIWLN